MEKDKVCLAIEKFIDKRILKGVSKSDVYWIEGIGNKVYQIFIDFYLNKSLSFFSDTYQEGYLELLYDTQYDEELDPFLKVFGLEYYQLSAWVNFRIMDKESIKLMEENIKESIQNVNAKFKFSCYEENFQLMFRPYVKPTLSDDVELDMGDDIITQNPTPYLLLNKTKNCNGSERDMYISELSEQSSLFDDIIVRG